MRLSEIYFNIDSLSIDLDECFIGTSYSSNDRYRVENIIKFKYLLEEIKSREINFYNEEIARLEKSAIYVTTADNIIVSASDAENIETDAIFIVNSLKSLNLVLSRITPIRNENSFLIKIPEPNDFEELTKDLTKIQKQINLIVSDKKIDTTANINNWEYGSFWIDIVIGTEVALGLLASITWTAAYISKELKKNKEANLYLERIGHETEHMEKVKETQLKYIEQLYENEILNIQENHFDNEEDNDRNLKIKNTIKLFADIINRGGEFQPSLIAPEPMKKKFPNLKNLELIESQIKQITETPESQTKT